MDKTTHTSSLMPAPSSQRGSPSNAHRVHRPCLTSSLAVVSLVPALPFKTFLYCIVQLSSMLLNHQGVPPPWSLSLLLQMFVWK